MTPSVDLWYLPVGNNDNPQIFDALALHLSDEERDRASRFHHAHDRFGYVAAHALKRICLASFLNLKPVEIEFETTRYRKPYVSKRYQSGIYFNLSHTKGMVTVAIARTAELGVDVEYAERKVSRGVADRILSDSEKNLIDQLPTDSRMSRIIRFWTLKEAYVKAKGTGLITPMESVSFHLFDDEGCVTFLPPTNESDLESNWSFHAFETENQYRVAVAANNTTFVNETASEIEFSTRQLSLHDLLNGCLNHE